MIKIDLYSDATNKRIEDILNSRFKSDLHVLHNRLIGCDFKRSGMITALISLDIDYQYDGFNMVIKKKFNLRDDIIDSVLVTCILYKIEHDNLKYKKLQSFSVEILSLMKERRLKIEKLGLI